jgi:hypothetical protein
MVERKFQSANRLKMQGKKTEPGYERIYSPRADTNHLSSEKEGDLQGNKIVEITKMLASDQYSVGKMLAEFRDKFLADLKQETKFTDGADYVHRV